MSFEQVQPDASDRSDGGTPLGGPSVTPSLDSIEQLMAQVGARYVADLRLLTETFGQYFAGQMAAKDDQIAALTRDIEAVEKQRSALQGEIEQLKRINKQRFKDLRTVAQEFDQRLVATEQGAGF